MCVCLPSTKSEEIWVEGERRYVRAECEVQYVGKNTVSEGVIEGRVRLRE